MTSIPVSARGRAGFVVVIAGAVLLALSVFVLDWVSFAGSVGGAPRFAHGLRFLEMGDHLSIVDIGIAAAYFGGLGIVLAALASILALAGTWPGGSGRRATRWAAVAVAVGSAALQIAVMSSVGNFEGGAGPAIGSFTGLLGYAALIVGTVRGPARSV